MAYGAEYTKCWKLKNKNGVKLVVASQTNLMTLTAAIKFFNGAETVLC